MDKANIEVIAGVNLPMLIKLASCAQYREPGAGGRQCAGCGQEVHQCREHAAERQSGQIGAMTASKAIVPGDFHRWVRVVNKRGLHARAAAKFVKMASQFQADIKVGHGGLVVSATSIMGLMMLGAWTGAILEMGASGDDRRICPRRAGTAGRRRVRRTLRAQSEKAPRAARALDWLAPCRPL